MAPRLFLPLQINDCSKTLLVSSPSGAQRLFLLSAVQASAPADTEEKIGLVLPGPQLAHAEAELNLHRSVDTTRRPGAKPFRGGGELYG